MAHGERTRRRDEWKRLLAEDRDFLKGIVQSAVQEILEAEMTESLQADKHERTTQRLGYRSGSYPRTLVTRGGTLELRVPQDREGRFSTEVFERYRRAYAGAACTASSLSSATTIPAWCKRSARSVPMRGGQARRPAVKRVEFSCARRPFRRPDQTGRANYPVSQLSRYPIPEGRIQLRLAGCSCGWDPLSGDGCAEGPARRAANLSNRVKIQSSRAPGSPRPRRLVNITSIIGPNRIPRETATITQLPNYPITQLSRYPVLPGAFRAPCYAVQFRNSNRPSSP
jgi:hypothetical protein